MRHIMVIKKIVLLVSIAGSIVATENNQHPGDIASKNHPQAFLAAKVAGSTLGVVGGVVGYSAYLEPSYIKDHPNFVARFVEGIFKPDFFCKGYRYRQLGRICMLAPVVYGSWKGGQAVSQVIWNSAWSGVAELQKLKESATRGN
jgi:hypothetical protein